MTPVLDLDRYTDGAAMRALLQARLPGFAEGHLRIDALAVRNARRNTSRERNPCPMTLCYELRVSDPASGRSGTQMLYAQVYRGGLAAPAYAEQDQSGLAPPAFGAALTHLAELDLLLWALPNDPGLPQLGTLLDPARAARVLPCGAGAGVKVELLRYTPRRRATLRYTLSRKCGSATFLDPRGGRPASAGLGALTSRGVTVDADADGRQAAPRQLYAKTFCDARAELIHQRFSHFWELAQADEQAPLLAQPLGYDVATRTLWQAPALGVPLRDLLTTPHAAALLGQVARALALLHAAPLAPAAGAPLRSVAHWVAEVRRRQRKIGRVNAGLAAQAACVADAIEDHAAHPATRALSLIHGDFHPDQIWVHQGRVVLFDFDEFTLGDPMEDLAEFVLKLQALGAAPALASVFVEQYAAEAPQRFDRRSLAWHLTVQSLLQASRAFIYQEPGWPQTLARRLAASVARAAALPLIEPT